MHTATIKSQTHSLVLAKKSAYKSNIAGHLTFLAPNREYNHVSRNKSVAIHLKRRENFVGPLCVGKSTGHRDGKEPSESLPTPSELVRTLYESINVNDMAMLNKLFAKNCIFEDSAYLKPLEGKMIHHFFHQLAHALGKHVEFVIDDLAEGSNLTVAVVWHLEWNNKPIPFTKGCSFFKCSVVGEEIFIQKAQIFEESPIKPGEASVECLKIVVSAFDKFPKLTEKFLEKPDAIFNFFAMLFKKFVEPLIVPFLIYYTNFWAFVVRIAKSLFSKIHSDHQHH